MAQKESNKLKEQLGNVETRNQTKQDEIVLMIALVMIIFGNKNCIVQQHSMLWQTPNLIPESKAKK